MTKNTNLKKKLLIGLPSILITLIPIFLITGPLLSDLSVSLVTIIFLYIVIKEKRYEYFNNSFFKLFILFYLYLLANSLMQNQNVDSLRISFFYFRFGIFSIGLMYFLNEDKNLLRNIYYSIIFCFLILIIDGLVQFFLKKNLLGFEIMKTASGEPLPRVSSFFGDEMILGSYLSRLFPILFGLYFWFANSKKNFYFFIPIFILTIILVFLSGERTSLFFIILSIIMMSILIPNQKKIVRIILVSFLITASLILSFSEKTRDRYIKVTLSQIIKSESGNEKFYILTRQHEEHYVSALRMFNENKIFGLGVKNFRNFCNEDRFRISDYTCSPHPHNTYVQLLSETGLIGFLFIFSIFLYFSYKLIIHLIKIYRRKYLYNDLEICLIIAFYLTLWPLVPSGNFFNNWLNIIYFFPVGIFLWSRSNSKNNIHINSR